MTRHQFQHIFIPLSIGCVLYILFRADGSLMFKWFDILGLSKMLNQSHFITFPFRQIIPTWAIYSLPDALWTYSLTTTMIFNWNSTFNKSSCPWILIGPFLAILSELAQYLGLLKGTFDIVDLIICFIASILALTHIKHFEIKTKENEKKYLYTY